MSIKIADFTPGVTYYSVAVLTGIIEEGQPVKPFKPEPDIIEHTFRTIERTADDVVHGTDFDGNTYRFLVNKKGLIVELFEHPEEVDWLVGLVNNAVEPTLTYARSLNNVVTQ